VDILNCHDWNWRGNRLATIADDSTAQYYDHKVVDHGNEFGDQQNYLGFRIVIITTNTFFEIQGSNSFQLISMSVIKILG
jgi:hypothetical protein